MVNPRYWCSFTVIGQELVAAHFLALQRYAMLGGGAVPGAATRASPCRACRSG